MAELLTTKGIGYFLDELFKSSKEYVYIVTPYIKVDPQLEERITEALDNGLKITLIFGKNKQQIKSVNFASRIDVYFYENLHAKFYINENGVLISSMNMLTYSEANNREIGVAFSRKDDNDKNIIVDCYKEFESIKKQSVKLNSIYTNSTDKIESTQNITNPITISTIFKSKYFRSIKAIIVDKLGVNESEILPDACFISDLGADSLDLVELVMEFEKEFNIAIPDDEAEQISTINQAIEYIEFRLSNDVASLIKPTFEKKEKLNSQNNDLYFEQQIYRCLLQEYRKNQLNNSQSVLSDNEISIFVLALDDTKYQIEKIISSDKKFLRLKDELIDRIDRIKQFTIARILDYRDEFKGKEVQIEIFGSNKINWFYTKEKLPPIGQLVAVKLNDSYFNKYIELEEINS
jgi:acyl carrier protein